MQTSPSPSVPLTHMLTGALLIAVTVLVAIREWVHTPALDPITFALWVVLVAALCVMVKPGRRAFVVAAVVLTGLLVWQVPDWQAVVVRALVSGTFIAAFFTALATLRSAAEPSPEIREAGSFLARQPPGRRYLALTLGGTGFALLLNYGSIALLGSLATAAAREEPDEEIRNHRRRRMLLAIQRGFVTSLPWSPLSFSIAITTALIPGGSWAGVFVPAFISAALMTLLGWGLDTVMKPKLKRPAPPRGAPDNHWEKLKPLAWLLGVLVVSVLVLGWITGLRIIALVLVIVPVMALVWTWMQTRSGGLPMRTRLFDYAFREMPGYKSEVLLLMMAGYIGTVGAPLLAPLVKASGFHPEDLPTWLVLVGLVWIVPLLGQFAMNPILAVSLIAPLLPSPDVLGIPPAAIVLAIVSGWALGGISSPFTATTLLTGAFGGVSARQVGVGWNGAYMLALLAVIPVWVLAYAFLFA
ncbi:hypothetical protein KO516_18855 [Citreicella sp. C3M06]|uniref:hypothetical protein n=1 Tax=Citreicella sp. C3M06 TaxID=2841564 RepID=UPI001C08DF94|nr:hypothetical protein [Citreicella sp. C3M06]MBU2962847.1 hypothetical protein [Citreicella sp. C3M06]